MFLIFYFFFQKMLQSPYFFFDVFIFITALKNRQKTLAGRFEHPTIPFNLYVSVFIKRILNVCVCVVGCVRLLQ